MNNKANGSGRIIESNGDIYEGELKDNKAHGIGKFIYANGMLYNGQL
jgi:hypothetical protein